MTPSPKRLASVAAASILLLSLAACGDDSGGDASGDGSESGGGSSLGGADSPEQAYADFVAAIRDDDADAFEAAVTDKHWSDLTELQDDDAANLAAYHWFVENDVMRLPDDLDDVRVGGEALPEGATGDSDALADQVGQMIGVDGLTGDDIAVAIVPQGWNTGLGNAANEAECASEEAPIEECLDEVDSGGHDDFDVIMVHTDDGWRVFGTEPSF